MRERAITNMGELFRGSSTLALRPRLQHYEGFPLESIQQDHPVPQHLQRVHTRTLGLTSRSLVPARATQPELTSLLRPHLYNALQYKVEHLMISSF